MIQIASYQEFQDIKFEVKEHSSRLDRIEILMEQLTNNVSNFQDEMREFKDEMREFKDEMREFKRNSEREHKAMNKRWGEISNKLGTIVEDLINPAAAQTIKRHFKCEIDYKAINIKKKIKNIQG